MKISLLTGGKDPHYVLGLLSGLVSKVIVVDLIGSHEMENSVFIKNENVNFYNFFKHRYHRSITKKTLRVLKYYFALIRYVSTTDSRLFHIQWLNKFTYFDRTILNIYYKALGKKLVFTAHNINAGIRDEDNNLINRLTLKFLYMIVDHIIVHTRKMQLQLIKDFNISKNKVSVIPFGINNIVPKRGLSRIQSRKKLKLKYNEKIILFFGNIAPYKGIEYLLLALGNLRKIYQYDNIRLIIAGRIKKDCQEYWEKLQQIIEENDLKDCINKRIEFIPDTDIEAYFISADVMVLSYKYIFQSGIIYMSYSFGLPVIVSDVGSLSEDIVKGKTGFICKPENPADLAQKIDLYFHSNLFKNLESNRDKIINYANEKYSWNKIGEKTYSVYKSLL